MKEGDLYRSLLDSLSGGIYVVDQNRVITYGNKGAETLTGYKNSEMVGKCCRGNILMYVDEQGRDVCEKECMAAESVVDGRSRSMEVYVRHKDGYRMPVLVRTSPIRNLNGQVIGAVEELCDNSSTVEFVHKIEELEKCVLLDPLTGLMKRRGLEMNLRSVFSVMHRHGWSYGIFFVDIDEFKRINDVYGDNIGDNVLKMVAKTLLNSVRASDMVGRWGGEELMVIAANVGEDHLYKIANKIRILIGQSGFSVGAESVRVTVSVCATMVQPDDSVDTLLKRINRLMEHCKVSGKNCVSV
ncbi:MAG: diguanylate cyclase [Candidatus Brocadia sinica]|nr:MULTISPECIES: GGDEF domain-containing protein [Brocadia]KXK27682.1 MAG: diguanylate cyclase [Candidatus Brocadia sinica]NOG42904.1 diguanylate cyclase [Planctomycetota bacterium]